MKLRVLVPLVLGLQSLSALNWGQFDQTMTYRLQGNNQHYYENLLFETVALGSPFLESAFPLQWYRSGFRQEATALASALVLTQLPVAVAKYAFHRPRPHRTYQPRLWNTRLTPSFPSGHVATTAAWAAFLSRMYPQSQFLLATYVGLSAYSQVYVGNHYVGDTFAGALVGWAVGTWIHGVWSRNGSKQTGIPPPLVRVTIPL